MNENLLAWRIWNLANSRDRQVTQFGGIGPLSTTSILNLCELYDATLEDFEKILVLERLLYKPGGEAEEKKPDAKMTPSKRALRKVRR